MRILYYPAHCFTDLFPFGEKKQIAQRRPIPHSRVSLFLFLAVSNNNDNTTTTIKTKTSETRRIEDVYSGVHDGPVLGTGVAGVVRKCTHRETGIEFAVKCLNIGIIESEEVVDALREEIFIMCQSDHPDIIRLEEVYESDSQIYLILDLLTGGDMFDRLEEQPNYRYNEIQCAKIVKQMTNAVRYLHSKNVVHRDLKLGALLLLLFNFLSCRASHVDWPAACVRACVSFVRHGMECLLRVKSIDCIGLHSIGLHTRKIEKNELARRTRFRDRWSRSRRRHPSSRGNRDVSGGVSGVERKERRQ